jgi:hypothetical protein
MIMFASVLLRSEDADLNYHLQCPIETVMLPKVTQIHQVEIGSGAASRMPTGDENIVEALISAWLSDESGPLAGFSSRARPRSV